MTPQWATYLKGTPASIKRKVEALPDEPTAEMGIPLECLDAYRRTKRQILGLVAATDAEEGQIPILGINVSTDGETVNLTIVTTRHDL